MWTRIRDAAGLNGFRYFHDHDPRVPAMVLADPRCAKIILTRNPVDSYVSLKIARETGQWKLGDVRHRKDAKVRFDGDEFEAYVTALQGFQMRILNALQISGQTAFYVGYEDVQDGAVLRGLLAFLGRGSDDAPSAASMVRQNPGDLDDKVRNSAEIAPALARIDCFNLTRTPMFEPRRGPDVPGFVAAEGRPLLYMPLSAGPEARVRRWLGGLGGDGVNGLSEDFTQKSLRDWRRATPVTAASPCCAIPLARAYAAFCQTILTGRLCRPPRGAAHDLTSCRCRRSRTWQPWISPPHRAAFVAFLGFLKANLAGQTCDPDRPALGQPVHRHRTALASFAPLI